MDKIVELQRESELDFIPPSTLTFLYLSLKSYRVGDSMVLLQLIGESLQQGRRLHRDKFSSLKVEVCVQNTGVMYNIKGIHRHKHACSCSRKNQW